MIVNRLKQLPQKAVLYCVITLGILVASLIRKDVDFLRFENRTMEYFHWPTVETVVSGEWFDTFEKYNLDQVIGRELLIEANSRGLYLMGKRQINDTTVYEDGTLLQASWDFPGVGGISDETISTELIPFRDAAESYGGQFYFVNEYPRFLYYWSGFPYHGNEDFRDYISANSDTMRKLHDRNIRTVDIYENMMSHSDEYLYFHTDHHHTYRGAYYTYQTLLDTINENNPDRKPLKFPALDEMKMIRPEGYFWGSIISQIGDRKYEGIDYLEYALPDDYPAKYERYESGQLSDMPLIRNDSTIEYGWFMNGDYGNTVIKTHRPELPSILIIGYSFTDATELLAVYNFNEMHSIDPRMFDGDITDYIRNAKCDYVILQDVI